MRVVSRKVISSHSKEEVFQIVKNSSSRYRPAEFADNYFQLTFPVRWHTQMGYIPVKGIVNHVNGFTEVLIEIHGGFTLYIGMLFFCVGLLILGYSLLARTSTIYSAVVCLGIGVLIYVIELFDGIACLDSLEHRLTRKLDE